MTRERETVGKGISNIGCAGLVRYLVNRRALSGEKEMIARWERSVVFATDSLTSQHTGLNVSQTCESN